MFKKTDSPPPPAHSFEKATFDTKPSQSKVEAQVPPVTPHETPKPKDAAPKRTPSFDGLLRQAAKLGITTIEIVIDVQKYAAPGEASVGGNVVMARAFTTTGKTHAYAGDADTAVTRVIDNMQRHPIASEPNPEAKHDNDPTKSDVVNQDAKSPEHKAAKAL